MRIIGYRKTDHGITIIAEGDVDPAQGTLSALVRYQALFIGVPLLGGDEWKTLSVDELVSICHEAASEAHDLFQRRRADAMQEHAQQWVFARWWREWRGWQPPEAPSREEIFAVMADECLRLSRWMQEHQNRPFYVDSDMSYLVYKPAKVAELLHEN